MNFPMILAFIAIAAILLTVFIVMSSSKNRDAKRVPNYKALFIIGVTWLPIGFATENPGLWGMGIVFVIAGLTNRDKWGQQTKWADLSPTTKKIKLSLIMGLAVLLLVGFLYSLSSAR